MTESPYTATPVEPTAAWRTVVRSFGTLATGETLARLLGMVAVVALARRLDPGSFGLVTLGTTLVLWFAIVVDSGTEILNVRDISRRPEQFKQIAGPVLGLRLALSLAAMLLLGLAAVVLARNGSDRLVLLLFALMLPMTALNLRWMVLGVRGARAVALGNVAAQLLFAIGILLLVWEPHDTPRVPMLQAAGEALYAITVIGLVARRHGLVLPRIDLAEWRRTFSSGLPLMANGFARAVIYSYDILLIGVVLERSDVGFYSVAYKPVLFLAGAMALFYIAFLSSFSQAKSEHATSLFRQAVVWATTLTTLLAVLCNLTSGWVVELAFGARYEPAAGVLAILIWTLPILAISGAYANALIAADRQSPLMRNNICAAVFNVLANAVAIPLAGVSGAAVVTLLSELLVTGLNYRAAVKLGAAPSLSTLAARDKRPLPSGAG